MVHSINKVGGLGCGVLVCGEGGGKGRYRVWCEDEGKLKSAPTSVLRLIMSKYYINKIHHYYVLLLKCSNSRS